MRPPSRLRATTKLF